MSLIPNAYMESVISIGIKIGDKTSWIGTGFFIVKKVGENRYQPFMVTNRHVLSGKNSVVIRLKEKNGGCLRELDMPLMKNDQLLYTAHSDKKVDIAVVSLNGGFINQNNLEFSAFNIEENAMSSKEFLDNGGDEGSYVYMLGFPMGLVNIDSNLPICRAGCVARIDESEVQQTKQMLLDIQNFPGNSGSPIIAKPELVGITGTKPLNRSVLIGIVNGYIPYKENLINAQTKMVVEIRSENSGIAVANPVEFIRETMDLEIARMNKKRAEMRKASADLLKEKNQNS